jgi:PilZ domain
MNHTEQRKFGRYHPPEGAIATLKPDAEFGLINDISRGGLAFEYLSFSNDRCDNSKIGCPKEIDLFIPGKSALPITVPCMVIRVEKRLAGSYKHSVVPKKHCGVQFMEFGIDAAMGLCTFLNQCTRKGEC